jgi:hypothetical protein
MVFSFLQIWWRLCNLQAKDIEMFIEHLVRVAFDLIACFDYAQGDSTGMGSANVRTGSCLAA